MKVSKQQCSALTLGQSGPVQELPPGNELGLPKMPAEASPVAANPTAPQDPAQTSTTGRS